MTTSITISNGPVTKTTLKDLYVSNNGNNKWITFDPVTQNAIFLGDTVFDLAEISDNGSKSSFDAGRYKFANTAYNKEDNSANWHTYAEGIITYENDSDSQKVKMYLSNIKHYCLYMYFHEQYGIEPITWNIIQSTDIDGYHYVLPAKYCSIPDNITDEELVSYISSASDVEYISLDSTNINDAVEIPYNSVFHICFDTYTSRNIAIKKSRMETVFTQTNIYIKIDKTGHVDILKNETQTSNAASYNDQIMTDLIDLIKHNEYGICQWIIAANNPNNTNFASSVINSLKLYAKQYVNVITLTTANYNFSTQKWTYTAITTNNQTTRYYNVQKGTDLKELFNIAPNIARQSDWQTIKDLNVAAGLSITLNVNGMTYAGLSPVLIDDLDNISQICQSVNMSNIYAEDPLLHTSINIHSINKSCVIGYDAPLAVNKVLPKLIIINTNNDILYSGWYVQPNDAIGHAMPNDVITIANAYLQLYSQIKVSGIYENTNYFEMVETGSYIYDGKTNTDQSKLLNDSTPTIWIVS